MLMIRLQRVGRKNDPSFRIVVTEKRNAAKGGKFLEVVGAYNARFGKTVLDKERAKHWLSHGVQLSDTAHNIFVQHKLATAVKKKFGNKPKKAAPTAPEAATPKVAKTEETPAAA